jgi:assimilatory nitrate reductase catalytic subunit
MGGREVGGLANLLSAHRDLANPEHRAEVARLWGLPSVPAQPGKAAVELFAALKRGEIKAVWIACTNPAQSLPDQGTVRAALRPPISSSCRKPSPIPTPPPTPT